MKVRVIALMSLLVCGCVASTHRVEVPLHPPRLTYTSTDMGSGRAIRLTVVDQRPLKQVLGHGLILTLVTKQEVRAVIERALNEGFSRMGFRLVGEPDASATSLIAELSYLDYKFFQTGRFDLRMYIWAGLRATVQRNGVGIYGKTYETVAERKGGPWGSDADNFNSVLADLIQQTLGDLDLLAALKSADTAAPVNAGVTPTAMKAQAVEIPESERGFYEGRKIHFIVDIPHKVERPHLRLLRYTSLIARHMHKYLPGSEPYRLVASEGHPATVFLEGRIFTQGFSQPGTDVYQAGAVADVYKGGKPDELTVGVWPGDRAVLQRAAVRDEVAVDWKRFQWIGGLQDDNWGSRFFFALPPGTPQTRVDTVRRAFENTVRNPGLLAEARMHQIDLGNMRSLGHQEVEGAL